MCNIPVVTCDIHSQCYVQPECTFLDKCVSVLFMGSNVCHTKIMLFGEALLGKVVMLF